MPQTSPMIWLLMSSTIPMLMTSFFSYFVFNTNNPNNNQNINITLYINKKNFNWMW